MKGGVGDVWAVCQGVERGLLGVHCWAHAGADVRVDGVGGCRACWEGAGTGRVDGLAWFLWGCDGWQGAVAEGIPTYRAESIWMVAFS